MTGVRVAFPANIVLSSLGGTTGFRMRGGTDELAGWSVASAGDINGDGFDDLIVGAPGGTPALPASGVSYLVFGKATPSVTVVNLSNANDASEKFELRGVGSGDLSGFSVASAGDVNGDGFDDLIIGAPYANANGDDAGASYVVFGKASGFGTIFQLSSLDGSNGFRLSGADHHTFSGWSVASAGDVNNDGFDDVIVGSPGRGPNYGGESYVVFGKASGFAANLDLGTLNGSNGFKLTGLAAFDQSGMSVASAGDVNGDGFDDIIVSSNLSDSNGTNAGASYVVFGKASGFGASVDLGALTGANGFKLTGVAAGDRSGFSVASAGDVNGDGFADLIVGAPYNDGNAGDAGAAYVVFGKASGFTANLNLSALNGTDGFRLGGVAAGDWAGYSVSSAGDFDGDGFDDLIVGAWHADANGVDSGASYLVFGKASGFGATFNLSTLDGTNGFRLSGAAANDWSGEVASAGDVNGDGYDDLIVGAWQAYPGSNLESGASYVVFGRAKGNVPGTAGSDTIYGGSGKDLIRGNGGADTLFGYEGNDRLVVGDTNFVLADGGAGTDTLELTGAGQTLDLRIPSVAAKLNGIERIDLALASSDTLYVSQAAVMAGAGAVQGGKHILVVDGNFGDKVLFTEPGWARVGAFVDGTDTFDRWVLGNAEVHVNQQLMPAGVSPLTQLNGSNGFKLSGAAAGNATGSSVASIGDINGDGFDDVILSLPNVSEFGSGAYVVYGKASGFAANLDLSTLNGANGFKLTWVAGEYHSTAVASAGDINGDGIDDLIVGVWDESPNGRHSGLSYVLFGKTAFRADVFLSLTDFNGSNGFRLTGAAAWDRSGRSVASAGDFNGDGFDDLFIGAWGADPRGEESGSSYIVFGKASGFAADFDLSTLSASTGLRLDGVGLSDRSGYSVASAGDVNGDGFNDVIVGAKYANPHGANSGASYVVFGRASGSPTLRLSTLDGNNGFKLSGVAAGDESGASVASAGDVNGDGFGDLIVGAWLAGSYAGAAYVVFGKASGFAANLDLSTLNGSNGFKLNSEPARDFAGRSAASAGDVNGDGYGDLIVTAIGNDTNGTDSGAVYVVFGKASGFAATIDLSTVTGSSGFALRGDSVFDPVGASAASAGDVNGDGYDDIILGTPSADGHGANSGGGYVVFGGAFGGTVTTTGTAAAEMLIGGASNDALTGGGGGDVFHAGAGNDRLVVADLAFRLADGGSGADTLALSGAGLTLDLTNPLVAAKLEGVERIDISGSGHNKLVVGSAAVLGGIGMVTNGKHVLTIERNLGDVVVLSDEPWTKVAGLFGDGTNLFDKYVLGNAELLIERVSYVVGYALGGANQIRLSGAVAGDGAGFSVASAGDLNGDGYADLIVGAKGADPNGVDSGISYVVFGNTAGLAPAGAGVNFELSGLDGSTGFKLNGVAAGDLSGASVASAGDVNGDGYDDLIVGSPMADANAVMNSGAAYVVFGKASGFAASVDLSTLNGTGGFRLSGAVANGQAGFSVASAGDVNGDGYDDVIVGVPEAMLGSGYVVFGKATGFAANLDLSSLDGSNGFMLRDAPLLGQGGFSVASAGDVNGDGYDDLIIGAPNASGVGVNGAAYVVFGKASFGATFQIAGSLNGTNGFNLYGPQAGVQLGFSVASAGDLNGDGYDDLIVGAKGADFNGSDSGASYVIYGKASGFSPNADISYAMGGSGSTFRLTGVAAGDESGFSAASAGDFNGDGFDDLIIGARYADFASGIANAGASYVVFGKAAGFPTLFNLSNLDGTLGFKLMGTAADDWSGASVSSAGDLNGDGFDDLIVGAPGRDAHGSNSGAAYVVYGGTMGVLGGSVRTTGTTAAEILMGDVGNDVLAGGGGGDVFHAGAGNDRLVVKDLAFRLADGGSGTDTLALSGASLSLNLPNPRVAAKLDGVERIDLAGTGDNTLVVDQLGILGGVGAVTDGKHMLVVEGNTGDQVQLVGSSWVKAGSFSNADGTFDRWVFDNAEVHVEQAVHVEQVVSLPETGVTITGTAGNDVISTAVTVSGQPLATSGPDIIEGAAGDDVLDGGDGNDALYGGANNDTLIGGAAAAGGTNQLWGGEGSDTASYAGTTGAVHADLAAQAGYVGGILVDQMNSIENLTGGSGSDVLMGNDNSNVLNGGAGNDVLYGQVGDDILIGGAVSAGGTNQLWGGTGSDTASYAGTTGAVHADLAAQNAYVDGVLVDQMNSIENLIGGSGDDVLTGDAGGNVLAGKLGNDTYVIGAGDTIVEAAGEGTDTVRASIDYTLGVNVENLVLIGTANLSGTGNGLANALTGNAGHNLLDGGAGTDTMAGGLGDDTYVVGSVSDLVIEAAGEGTDTVLSSITYALTANVENLTLTGADAINGTGNALDNWLTGNAAANTLSGGLGNDTYVTDSLADTIVEAAGEGTDTVRASIDYTLGANLENLVLSGTANLIGTGNGLANILTGNAGDNLLDGGAGADTMAGGLGNDTYVIGAGDTIAEAAGGGTDTVRSSISYTLTANVEELVLIGNGTLSGTGNALANNLIGGDGLNVLDGGAGADTMAGRLGNDTYVVDDLGDVVVEAANEGVDTVRAWVDHTLTANVEKIVLQGTAHLKGTGNALDNGLTGNAGNNLLDGGTGADTMVGGLGDDTYIVDNAGDVASEEADAGLDTVRSSVSLRLRSHVENLALAGSDGINGTGNDLANVLTGNAGNNVLDGGAGDDTMGGGVGDDTYVMDVATDKITELVGQGMDTVQASFTYVLRTNFENLTLTGSSAISAVGNAVANVLIGNAGANALDGRAGADTMQGGAGDDTYYVENAGDVVIEVAGKGTDAVKAWLDYTLSEHVEKLVLQGTDDLNGTGNSLDNTLVGNAGNNVLDGGAGADSMSGEEGDDTFFIDNAGDRASEDAGEGFDTLFSSLSYVLRPNLEKLVLTGTADINGVGNAENNILDGNDGGNTLDGRAGADTMTGGLGDDKYVVDSAGDVVVELADQGIDSVRSWISYTLGANLEKLTLYGAANLDGAGNDLINTVIGNSGRNILDGGLGSDTLSGEGGGDTFRFSTALGTSNFDKILVFDHAADTIQLDDAIFAALGTGALGAGAFNTGMAATQADDRILFDTASKSLSYDADGVGGVAAVKFATIATLTGTLDHTDFFVV